MSKMTEHDKERLAYLRACKKDAGLNGARWVVWGLCFETARAKRAAEKVVRFRKGRLDE